MNHWAGVFDNFAAVDKFSLFGPEKSKHTLSLSSRVSIHFFSYAVLAILFGCRFVKEKNRASEHNGSTAKWPFGYVGPCYVGPMPRSYSFTIRPRPRAGVLLLLQMKNRNNNVQVMNRTLPNISAPMKGSVVQLKGQASTQLSSARTTTTRPLRTLITFVRFRLQFAFNYRLEGKSIRIRCLYSFMGVQRAK